MMAEDKAAVEKKPRISKVIPQNPGDKDKAGYELVKKQGNKAILMTPKGKFGVYENPWISGERCLLTPVKALEEAQHFLDTGKKIDPPSAEKKVKKEVPEKKQPKNKE